ncbi:group XIIA secretory phospholipase A2-like [Physella acuta]|uniref:group XIIA secretory phospholipase A2-like n=1 Tax=Physella acuta TaxID=109671 RepID=UPI0027DDFD03|nr:group XIIA secretory phospholipase A2-like [Physella acuta]
MVDSRSNLVLHSIDLSNINTITRLNDDLSQPWILLTSLLPIVLLLVSGCWAQEASKAARDILGSLQDVVANIQDYIGDKNKGCFFECPNGKKPKANPDHKPSSNGCGAFGIQLDEHIQMKEVTSCCNKHDICYDTCNKSKDNCDTKFKDCLLDVCKNKKKLLTKEVYQACLSSVDMMYAGTVALGCKPYREAQRNACICKPVKTEL